MAEIEFPHKLSDVYLLGDTHSLVECAKVIAYQLPSDALAIQLGDIGFWPNVPNHKSELEYLSRVLDGTGTTLAAIRGNHDKKFPAFSNTYVTPKFLALQDYTTLKVAGLRILCVGGAYSVDRAWRIAENSPYYDPDEPMVLGNVTPHDILLTHTGPRNKIAHLLRSPEWFKKVFLSTCPKLKGDLAEEQRMVDEIIKAAKPRLHAWGHYHISYKDLTFPKSVCLNINEVLSLEDLLRGG